MKCNVCGATLGELLGVLFCLMCKKRTEDANAARGRQLLADHIIRENAQAAALLARQRKPKVDCGRCYRKFDVDDPKAPVAGGRVCGFCFAAGATTNAHEIRLSAGETLL